MPPALPRAVVRGAARRGRPRPDVPEARRGERDQGGEQEATGAATRSVGTGEGATRKEPRHAAPDPHGPHRVACHPGYCCPRGGRLADPVLVAPGQRVTARQGGRGASLGTREQSPASAGGERHRAQRPRPRSVRARSVRVRGPEAHVTWLQSGGRITYGPVRMEPGADGDPTPRGIFHVAWKAGPHYISTSYGVPIPYAVFFAAGGVAFHEGSLTTSSHGCIHLTMAAARYYNEHLPVGAEVAVF